MKEWFSRAIDKFGLIVVGIILLLAAVTTGYLGSRVQNGGKFSLEEAFTQLWSNGATELASIAITVLLIGWLTERQARRNEKNALILQMGSPDRGFAVEAVRILHHRTWLTDGSLQGQTFTNANLQRANLQKADLRKAKLNHCHLQEADFTYAQLQNADLGGSKFWKLRDDPMSTGRAATFWHANLEGAKFGSAELQEVEFGGANLQGVDFTGAKLNRIKVNDDTIVNDETKLPDGSPCITLDNLNQFINTGRVIDNPFW